MQSGEHQALGYEAQLKSIVLLSNVGTLPVSEARLDTAPDWMVARKIRIFVSGIDPATARNYGEVVDDPADADIAIMRVTSGGSAFDSSQELDISIPEETLAMVEAVADTGVPTIVGINLTGSLTVLPKELIDMTAGTLMLFDVLDGPLLDVAFGRLNSVGKLPFDIPSSMESVKNQLEDIPFDLEDPIFGCGHGLSY